MDARLHIGQTTIPLHTLEMRQGLGGGLRLRVGLERDQPDQFSWLELGRTWLEGNARLELGDKGEITPEWKGTGWTPWPGSLNNGNQPGFLHATVLDAGLGAWLAASALRGPWLLCQRRKNETPWDFLKRLTGGYLGGAVPEDEDTWDSFIPPGACFARPPGMNNAEFLSFLAECLHSLHPPMEGWTVLREQIFFLTSQTGGIQEPVVLDQWMTGDGGCRLEPRGLDTAGRSFDLVWSLQIDSCHAFLKQVLEATQVTFTMPGMPFPWLRTPWLVKVRGLALDEEVEVLVCQEVRYELHLATQTCRMTLNLRRPRRVPEASPAVPLWLQGLFKAWNGKQAVFTPATSQGRPWEVMDTWEPDLKTSQNLDAAVTVPGTGAAMLRFLLQPSDEQSLLLLPGQMPMAIGTRQKDGDLAEGSSAELSAEKRILLQTKELHAAGVLKLSPEDAELSTKLKVQDVEIGQ